MNCEAKVFMGAFDGGSFGLGTEWIPCRKKAEHVIEIKNREMSVCSRCYNKAASRNLKFSLKGRIKWD